MIPYEILGVFGVTLAAPILLGVFGVTLAAPILLGLWIVLPGVIFPTPVRPQKPLEADAAATIALWCRMQATWCTEMADAYAQRRRWFGYPTRSMEADWRKLSATWEKNAESAEALRGIRATVAEMTAETDAQQSEHDARRAHRLESRHQTGRATHTVTVDGCAFLTPTTEED